MADDDELRPSSTYVPDERHLERSSRVDTERFTKLAPKMAPIMALVRPLNQASPACSQAPSVASTSTLQAPSVASPLLRGSFSGLDAGGADAVLKAIDIALWLRGVPAEDEPPVLLPQ